MISALEAQISARLRRIEATIELGALLTYDSAGALARARALSHPSAPRGPLWGRALVVKDLFTTRWGVTTAGSRHLAHFQAGVDATAVARAIEAGAILLGKANLDEFGMGGDGQHSALQPMRHNLDPARTPGGSSGGVALALAEGLAELGIGSDTGGSVRQPAALCGVVGFKPSYGRISRAGLIGFAPSLDHVGLMARSVEDISALYMALAGPDGRDMTALTRPPTPPTARGDLRGVTLGDWRAPDITPGMAEAFERAVADLQRRGARVVSRTPPDLRDALRVYHDIACAEAFSELARYDGVRFGARAAIPEGAGLRQMVEETRALGLGDEVKRRVLRGALLLDGEASGGAYEAARWARARLKAQIEAQLEGIDALICPTTPCPAPRLDALAADPGLIYDLDRLTAPANLMGGPAITIPMGQVEGLPAGLQLIGRVGEDAAILSVAAACARDLERAP